VLIEAEAKSSEGLEKGGEKIEKSVGNNLKRKEFLSL